MKLTNKLLVLLEDRDLQEEIKDLPSQDIADLFRAMQSILSFARDEVFLRCHQEMSS